MSKDDIDKAKVVISANLSANFVTLFVKHDYNNVGRFCLLFKDYLWHTNIG